MCFFFFSSRRRHTRSLCDWSSDVCSSDLPGGELPARYQDPCRQQDQGQPANWTGRGGKAGAVPAGGIEGDALPAHGSLISPISEYTEITDYAPWRRNDSLAGQDQAGDLAHAAPELEEAPEIGDGERAELPVGRIHGLHELEQLAETLLRLGVGRSRPV